MMGQAPSWYGDYRHRIIGGKTSVYDLFRTKEWNDRESDKIWEDIRKREALVREMEVKIEIHRTKIKQLTVDRETVFWRQLAVKEELGVRFGPDPRED